MVLLTALIRVLHARFDAPVDILTSGAWSEPLLLGQPGVGDIYTLRSRKTPYWLSTDQRRAVRWLRARGPGPAWFCDSSEAARPLLLRAGLTHDWLVDVADNRLLPGEHATEQWRRIAQVAPPLLTGAAAPSALAARWLRGSHAAETAAAIPGCSLEVSEAQRIDLQGWLGRRGLSGMPLILVQIGNKRTMRRGLRRLAVNHKYWPNDRWAEVIRNVRETQPGHAVLLLGTGPEYELNRLVQALAQVKNLHNVADDLPVPRLLALLQRAAALITVDSGPAHAAAAVGCPQVVLFGRALPSLYRPWGSSHPDVKLLRGEIAGVPDMLGVTTREVIEAWSHLTLREAPG